MLDKPKLEHRDEQFYVAIRTQVAMTEIPVVLPPLIPEVFAWLKEQGVEPAGAPFFRYLGFDGENRLQVEVGVPVPATLPGNGRVRAGVFPAGPYATLTHTGPYDLLRGTWKSLEDWKQKRGIKEAAQVAEGGVRWGTRTEFYLTSPDEEPDPEKWETEMVFLTGDDAAGRKNGIG